MGQAKLEEGSYPEELLDEIFLIQEPLIKAGSCKIVYECFSKGQKEQCLKKAESVIGTFSIPGNVDFDMVDLFTLRRQCALKCIEIIKNAEGEK